MRPRWRIPETQLASDLGLLAVALLTIVTSFALTQLLAGTLLLDLLAAGFLLATPVYGLVRWIRSGHGWRATLSWTVPLAAWMLVFGFAHGVPFVVRWVTTTTGWVFGVAMVAIPETGEWWRRKVLRTQPPDVGPSDPPDHLSSS